MRAIDADAMIDRLKEWDTKDKTDKALYNFTLNRINEQPTIQPKRGKWIRTGSGSLYDHYECSECGKAPKWECMGDNRWKISFTGFCPNCGAKMEVTT